MPAAVWKITIEQGATWRTTLTWSDETGPIDLTGFAAKLQIRSGIDSPTPLLELTSAPGGGITLGGAAGTIAIVITDETTAAIGWRYGLYDLELTSGGGETTRLLKGEVEVDAEVTR